MMNLPVDERSKKPKYLQLVDSIVKQIEEGKLTLDQKLPSVNKMSRHLNFSRETVFKALNHLSEKGVVRSVDKVGYFVNDVAVEKEYKVFFMLDKFTSFKEDLFNALIEHLHGKAKVDVFFHHQNFELFSSLILHNLKNYTHFVITTYLDGSDPLPEILNKIPAEKRIIIDKYEPNLQGDCGMIHQDFENDIFRALSGNLELVNKYERIALINHENAPHGAMVKVGFEKFCNEYDFDGAVQDNVDADHFKIKTLYITIDAYDRDLVDVIKLTRAKGWNLGNEIGLISYNDTPVKEILEGGITVISTDFREMGHRAAQMILEGRLSCHANPTHVIIRRSL